MPAILEILADFDNIQIQKYRRDPFALLLRIAALVEVNIKGDYARIRLRYYGGWYEGTSLTRSSQELIGVIGTSPTYVVSFKGARTLSTIELAHGIAALPAISFSHTVRHRTKVMDLNCKTSREIGCMTEACPMDMIQSFVRQSQCPHAGCETKAREVLKKREQKLVDTCLALDIIHLGYSGHMDAVLVSSDDDFWPALLGATQYGVNVHRIRTQAPSASEENYHRLAPNRITNYDL